MNKPLIAGVVFLLFSIGMLLYAIRNYRKAKSSTGWPSVDGRVVNLSLWGTRNIEGEMKPVEHISIDYEYYVDGVLYTGTRVAFYTLVYPQTVSFAEGYSENSDIRVFYQADRPAESVLIPGLDSGNKPYSEIILAGIGSVVSGGLIVASIQGLLG